MAVGEVTGATVQELAEMRYEYKGTPNHQKGIPFGDAYCLTRIGKQPEDYTGPDRYCRNRAKSLGETEYADRCRFHGGESIAGKYNENLDCLANMSHGYYAHEESLKSDLSDSEQRAYDAILDAGAEVGITAEEDLFSYEELVSLALNIVTDGRLRQILNEEGVEKTVEDFDEQGIKIGEHQEEHHLLGLSQSQRRLIMKMKEQLGLSRKHRDEMAVAEESNSIEVLMQGMAEAVDDDDTEYDPDDWG